MFYKNNHRKDKGISLILTILILSSLTVVTFAISDIVLRTGQSARKIGHSEIAYYAAETAVEKALYEIEKQKTIRGLDGQIDNLEEITDANWSLSITPLINLTAQCITVGGQEKGCITSSGNITTSNPLTINLNSGSSFQLDLNFQDLLNLEPGLVENLQISCGNNGEVITLGTNGQTPATPCNSPINLNNLDSNLYIIRLVNEDNFTLKPLGQKNLPIGISVVGTGNYKDQTRILEMERQNWQIY